MNKMIFNATVEQELSQIFCYKTGQNLCPLLILNITFHMDYSDTHWESIPYGKIVFDEIINCQTNEKIDYNDLPIIAQLECNKYCREYLLNNKLDSYENVIPINSYPYRMHNPGDQDINHFAEIIPFSHT